MTLYDFLPSGNGYKVRLLLAHLGRHYTYVPVDILGGETRTPGFLALNPNGRIPVLTLDDGRVLTESNAILWYLAQGTPYWPAEDFERARVLQWLFFEQYSHEPNIATLRFWLTVRGTALSETEEAQLPGRREQGERALGVMEQRLATAEWLAGERFGIADIALYAYTHMADAGGFDLAGYPGIRAWLARVRELPRHVSIDEVPAGNGR